MRPPDRWIIKVFSATLLTSTAMSHPLLHRPTTATRLPSKPSVLARGQHPRRGIVVSKARRRNERGRRAEEGGRRGRQGEEGRPRESGRGELYVRFIPLRMNDLPLEPLHPFNLRQVRLSIRSSRDHHLVEALHPTPRHLTPTPQRIDFERPSVVIGQAVDPP